MTKRGFVKKFKEMNKSHPFLTSGKYDPGAGAVEEKPKKINVCYIDYIVRKDLSKRYMFITIS